MIAALYVETNGVYFGRTDVDPWDESRDARQYAGPWPVVAHPPCQRWGSLAIANFARWGGEHNRPGNDGGCFLAALIAVRKWGGVLEHPAKTRAWKFFGLTRPSSSGGWSPCDCGWVCEVWQSVYGHKANKATWLYYCGEAKPVELDWRHLIGTHQCGFHDQRGKSRNKPTISGPAASRTPKAFSEVLLSLARTSRPAKQDDLDLEDSRSSRELFMGLL
jgi:hypothetical protein